jgi:hypothetical protein
LLSNRPKIDNDNESTNNWAENYFLFVSSKMGSGGMSVALTKLRSQQKNNKETNMIVLFYFAVNPP